MQPKIYSFNKINFNLGIPLLVFIILLLFFLTIYILTFPNPIALFFVIAFSLFIFYFFYMGFMGQKIIISDECIEYEGILRHYKINWNSVKSIGIIRISSIPFFSKRIDEKQMDKYSFWGPNFIYVSTESFVMLSNINRQGFICLQYRKDVYDLIKEKVKKNDSFPRET